MSEMDQRKRWKQLESYVKRLERGGLKKLTIAEIDELGHLYRQAAIDLSRARAGSEHPDLIRYLNHLAARAHGQIYRARRVKFVPMFMFLVTGFPRLVRIHAVPLLCAIGVFLGTAFASFVAVVNDPAIAYSLFDENMVEFENIRLEKQQGEYRGNFTFKTNESPLMAAKIIANNVTISMKAFAFGALLGLPCLYLLFYNGRMLGTLEAIVYNHGYFNDFNALILTHGVFELTAICIAGGSGFLLARAVIAPGERSRRDALKSVSRDAFGLLAGCVAMLVVAGIIEAFITPHYSQGVRWSVATICALFLAFYFGLAGRSFQTQPSAKAIPAT
jgi:uncharacterized membrane protein SpoIIM required for sporulation